MVYLAAGWSVIAAVGLAGLTLAVHATALGGALSHLVRACVLRLRATYGTPGGATVAGLGLTLAGAVALARRSPRRRVISDQGIEVLRNGRVLFVSLSSTGQIARRADALRNRPGISCERFRRYVRLDHGSEASRGEPVTWGFRGRQVGQSGLAHRKKSEATVEDEDSVPISLPRVSYYPYWESIS